MAQLATSYERDGYDGTAGRIQWWFYSWGTGSRNQWTTRDDAGRPPRPSELRSADYITIAFRHPSGHVTYNTRTGGLDLDPRIARKRKRKGKR